MPPSPPPNILFPSNSLTTKATATATRRGRRSSSSVAGQKLEHVGESPNERHARADGLPMLGALRH